jgi:FAD/FMN-containing dehydrogenase
MASPQNLPPAFVEAVEKTVGSDALSVDRDDLTEYGKDWTKVFAPNPSAIAFPRTTAQVSTLLRLAAEHDVPVVPSGGRTGLAGGAVAADRELVISLARMRRMDPVDTIGATVRVQAGAITEEVHRHAAEHGLTWPVDFASKGSSQVGGNIATNAGGVKVIRYGLTRQWVLGLEVVLMGGKVLHLNGALEKNNTGTDLRQLFIGSEGTLGIVTEATLKLTRLPGQLRVFLFAVPSLEGVLELFRETRQGPFTVMAYEFFTDRCFARLQKHRKLRLPLSTPATHYVLLEIEQADESRLDAWMASLFERELALDGTMAQNSSQAAELWALREGISESLSATGLPHKNDIALPITELEPFCRELESVFAAKYRGWEICLFGHVGDGNLHINVMKPDALDTAAFRAKTKDADHEIFRLVKAHRGTISAEHGIGLLKKDYLGYSRAPEEIEVLRAVKRALDPKNLLNPGKIIDV